LDDINRDMMKAEEALEGMEKCCGVCILPWKRYAKGAFVYRFVYKEKRRRNRFKEKEAKWDKDMTSQPSVVANRGHPGGPAMAAASGGASGYIAKYRLFTFLLTKRC